MKRILALLLAAVLLAAVFQLAIPVVRIPVIALVQERNVLLHPDYHSRQCLNS